MRAIKTNAMRLPTGYSFVCNDCGGLSLEALDPSAEDRLVRCGRCNAVRGTIQGLQEMGRLGLGGVRLSEAHLTY
jgi:predicted nucleic acid-binding Zn ribbon protein